ncbi:MAG: DoxX family membrane protein, partial [Myxococcota bacterium]|nr:DoxX family membrane protein [Myxococcota bacterium]
MSLIERIPPRARFVAVVVLRIAIAGVFVAAALPKLMDPASFARDIDNYHLLPDALIGPMAVALPMIELVVAAALLSGVHAAGAALVAMGMLIVFAFGMAQAMSRGIDLDCGCFGSATETRVSGATIARNVVLALACVPIVLARPRARVAPR